MDSTFRNNNGKGIDARITDGFIVQVKKIISTFPVCNKFEKYCIFTNIT
jgi:hypothetical protein